MKNITRIIHLILTTLFFVGCTDLEEEPEGLLAPESFFRTPTDVEAAVIGAYAEWVTVPISRDLSLMLMLRSDMADIGDRNTNGHRIAINDFAMDASNNLVSDVWTYFYRAISAANTAATAAQQIEAEQAIKDRLEAEARFIRAYSYFHLVRLFGDVPYLDGPIESAATLDAIDRTPENEVYTHIEDDLIFAKEHLPMQQSGDIRNRASAGTAATVLADVYLTLGEFANAATEARYVISNAGSFNYQLEDDYQDLFNGNLSGNLQEPILTLDFHNSLDANNYNVDWLIAQTRIRDYGPRSLSVPVPSLAVYNAWDNRDYRKHVSFEDSVMINGVLTALTDTEFTAPRPHIAKYFRYPGPQDAGDDRFGDLDYIYYRYADVLLIAAEAITESEGVTAEAIGYINQIRERARFNGTTVTDFPADVNAAISTADFINVVREERRLELCFEFKRWYDIKRWDILEETFTGSGSLEPHNVDMRRDYLFPIPQTEVDVTGFTQNTGY